MVVPPIIVTLSEPVVDVRCFFMGLRADIQRMSDFSTDLTRLLHSMVRAGLDVILEPLPHLEDGFE